jgi:hypothetical protein
VTVIVSRLPEEKLARLRSRQEADLAGRRARRVAGGRQGLRRRRDERVPGTAPVPETAVQEIGEETVAGVEETEAGTPEAELAEPTAAEATISGSEGPESGPELPENEDEVTEER